MCEKTQFNYCPSTIDKCMRNIVKFINTHTSYKTLSCCCGHNKYEKTLIVIPKREYNMLHKKGTLIYPMDVFSRKIIFRKKRFYKKDKQGYYYIPEVENAK